MRKQLAEVKEWLFDFVERHLDTLAPALLIAMGIVSLMVIINNAYTDFASITVVGILILAIGVVGVWMVAERRKGK